jgi:hypothetical protein
MITMSVHIAQTPDMQKPDKKRVLAIGIFASSLFFLPTLALSAEVPGTSAVQAVHGGTPYHEVSVSKRAREYYLSVWGVDNLQAQRTASGNLIRFSYRVTNPVKASALGDEHATPYLFGQRSNALLHVPVMEKVGQLRQSGNLEAGKEYWMVFSNKGDMVKTGDKVNVIVGTFHADGLRVE